MTALTGILALFTLTIWLGKRTRQFNIKTFGLIALIAFLQVVVTLYAVYTMERPL